MTIGGMIALLGWGVFLASLGTFLAALWQEADHRLNNRLWSAIVSGGLVVGLVLMAVSTVWMIVELSHTAECVADQSALVGVCVPPDQAG